MSQGHVKHRDICGMEKIMSPLLPRGQEETAVRTLPPQAKQHPLQFGNPARRKVSESNTFVSRAGCSMGMSPSISVLQASA
ncbi:hypothetical protein SKAU_G00095580 [Synaphobranchus kaupii]|uniref:Uncharacterized protein n=1 Tax=Synaphobranchus kaupii TaxID=118154 RepID=A0A9Q1FXJ6_SYNKA|nr:hypothetical protein SKAU_G00095580 [Synaphobranchus kaupii]